MKTQYQSLLPKHQTLKEQLDGSPGFATGLTLNSDELQRIKQLIEHQWLTRIQEVAPEQAAEFQQRGIAHYHELSHLLDHGSLWSRDSRLLSQMAVVELRKMSLFQQLESAFGHLLISDEEYPGKEVVHWRLVRPHQSSDVGPIHADKWFWDLNQWPMPSNRRRIKVWIAIVCEPGLSGLRIVPNSHLKDWPYLAEERHGVFKPKFEIEDKDLPLEMFSSQSGDAIIFHDQLLHGGAVSQGQLTRVSLEFTLLVLDQND